MINIFFVSSLNLFCFEHKIITKGNNKYRGMQYNHFGALDIGHTIV